MRIEFPGRLPSVWMAGVSLFPGAGRPRVARQVAAGAVGSIADRPAP
jgi:hypothetical protein